MRLELFLEKNKMIGIFVGRMSPPTRAHQAIINLSLSKYAEVYVVIIEGMQTSLLSKNFLTFDERKKLLHITNPGVKPLLARQGYLPDIIKENHINTVHGIAIIAGTDRIDSYMKQFKKEDYSVIADEIKRTEKDVSAGKVRDTLARNDFASYKKMVAKGLDNHQWFQTLRGLLIKKQKNVKEEILRLFGGMKKLYEKIKNMLFGGKMLKEESVNKHIEHYEDNVFNMGAQGIKQNIAIAYSIKDMLTGDAKFKNTSITVKWDGAPAVIFGKNPEDGKFFVSTKSLFNVTPKLGRTDKEIDENFGHSPTLAKKLKVCLKYLSKLNIKTMYQGDLLFTDDKKNENIDGDPFITFTPNTITYAIPDDDSSLAKKIRASKMGIVIHTEYTGKSLQLLSAKFNIDVTSHFNNRDIWIQDAYIKDISGIVNLERNEQKAIDTNIDSINDLFARIDTGFFSQLRDSKLFDLLKMFNNVYVKEGKPVENPGVFINDFSAWINDKYKSEISKLKIDKAKKSREVERDAIISFMKTYKNDFINAITIYSLFIIIKLIYIRRFEKIDNIKALIKTSDGEYRVSAPEGFCVIDNDGSVLKLVDRLEFSRSNFLIQKSW